MVTTMRLSEQPPRPRDLVAWLALATFWATCWASCSPTQADPMPLLAVAGDAVGFTVDPRPHDDDVAVVWVFVTTDCPIANAYAPEIQAIADDYADRHVRMLVIHTDPGTTNELAAAHARDHGYLCPVVVDRNHTLVHHAGVTMTPEAAVFDSDGSLRYRGRIDDRFPDLGARRATASSTDLRAAIDAVALGREVAVLRTEPVGCVIEGLER